MGSVVKSVVGAFTGGGSKPKVSTAAVDTTKEEQARTKTQRSALYETAGGVAGSELNPEEVGKRRNTLLGN